MTKKIVFKVEDGMDRQEILCTTYQMRNYYKQLRDGFFTTLDTMNYIQHHQMTKWCKSGNRVLDVCCGRGLMLPLLRYYCKDIHSYTGVDIHPPNAKFLTQRVTDGKPIDKDYYPFGVNFVESNVASMSEKLTDKYDVIIYTSAIEHMHKNDGQKSLLECRKVISDTGRMYITCPNTPNDKDGYDTQYKAHVYEWKRNELKTGLENAGFIILDEWGLHIGVRDLEESLAERGLLDVYKRIRMFIPKEWVVPVFAPLVPELSKEIGFIVKPNLGELL